MASETPHIAYSVDLCALMVAADTVVVTSDAEYNAYCDKICESLLLFKVPDE